MSLILGIDPGTLLLGYALLALPTKNQAKPQIVLMDSLDLRGETEQGAKLQKIFEQIQSLIHTHQPQYAAIEAPFFGKDVQAMLKLGRSQGIALLCFNLAQIPYQEYSPKEVKKAVTGKGNASKEQLAAMLQHQVLGQVQGPSLDASDALGVAYCHYRNLQQISTGAKKYDNWASFLKQEKRTWP